MAENPQTDPERPGEDPARRRWVGFVRSIWLLAFLAALAAVRVSAQGLTLTPLERPGGGDPLPIRELFTHPDAATNVSGTTFFQVEGRPFAAVVVDEGTEFALIDLGPGGGATRHDLLALLDRKEAEGLGETEEIDLEGVAYAGGRLYLAGSACLKRKKPSKATREANRKRLLAVEPVSGGEKGDWKRHSDMLYVLDLRLEGAALVPALAEIRNVRKSLRKEKILERASGIPSKENGLDVEGFAAFGDRVWFGMRGPVLRGHAVVARFDAGEDRPHLSFLALGGLGIRSMEWIDHPRWGSGVFVVAGPTMEAPGPFSLYRWDGESDAFQEPGPGLEFLGSFPAPDIAWKAESLFACGEELCVAFDGPAGGAPHVLR